jgi:hypothetical protein
MWHEFENYVKVEIWGLHSQFTNGHFRLHITVEMTALNNASVFQTSSSTHALFTSTNDVLS